MNIAILLIPFRLCQYSLVSDGLSGVFKFRSLDIHTMSKLPTLRNLHYLPTIHNNTYLPCNTRSYFEYLINTPLTWLDKELHEILCIPALFIYAEIGDMPTHCYYKKESYSYIFAYYIKRLFVFGNASKVFRSLSIIP